MNISIPTNLVLLATYGLRGPADGATIGWIVVGAVVGAAVGKRWLNRTSAVLLGGVGGTIAAGMFHNLTGAGLGSAIGAIVVASPWFRKPRRACESPGGRAPRSGEDGHE